jgi:hypothetical protein
MIKYTFDYKRCKPIALKKKCRYSWRLHMSEKAAVERLIMLFEYHPTYASKIEVIKVGTYGNDKYMELETYDAEVFLTIHGL